MDYEFIAIFTGWSLTIMGLWYNAKESRELQRKQLSIKILSEVRFKDAWIQARNNISPKLSSTALKDSTLDKSNVEKWESLAKLEDSGSSDFNEEKRQESKDIKLLLNNFEFVSMAVLSNTINGYTIQQSWGFYYRLLYKCLGGYIRVSREIRRDPKVFINFTTLTERWYPELAPEQANAAKPQL